MWGEFVSGSNNSLEWRGGTAIDEMALDAVETQLGVRFPEDYRACVLVNDGGAPDKTEFSYLHSDLGEFGGCFGSLLRLGTQGPDSLLWTLEAISDRLPARVIPFMEDPGGDCACFDFRTAGSKDGAPPLVYWTHDCLPERSLTFLAGNFAEFLEMLT